MGDYEIKLPNPIDPCCSDCGLFIEAEEQDCPRCNGRDYWSKGYIMERTEAFLNNSKDPLKPGKSGNI